MKYEKNWRFKSLENLEKDCWGTPNYDSNLATTCHKLRQKPLNEFSTEDLRIMISQDIGLKYLMPFALESLKANILAEGDLYPGDLLNAVLNSDKQFWQQEDALFNELETLLSANINLLNNSDFLENFNSLKTEINKTY